MNVDRTSDEKLSVAINLLAEWTLCVELNGSSWDDWDECYKEAAYRPGPLRELLDAERERLKREDLIWKKKVEERGY